MSHVPGSEGAKRAFVLSTVEPMGQYSFPSIGTMIEVVDNETGRHLGSALRLRIGERCVALSARHVVESGATRIAVSIGKDRVPLELTSPRLYENKAFDVVAYFLPDAASPQNVDAWSDGDVDVSDDKLSTDLLFVHGFPSALSDSSQLLVGVVSNSLAYRAMQREDELPLDMTPFQFAMDFDLANFKLRDGAPASWTVERPPHPRTRGHRAWDLPLPERAQSWWPLRATGRLPARSCQEGLGPSVSPISASDRRSTCSSRWTNPCSA